jgi:hypothetical protein
MKILGDYVWTRELNLKTDIIKKTCIDMEEFISDNFKESAETLPTYKNSDGSTSPFTTNAYSSYNLLLYPRPGLHDLYKSIRETFNLIKRKSNIKYDEFYIQCWLNMYEAGQKLDWHGHYPPECKAWHGFYCVNVKDSVTSYELENRTLIDVKCKDNLLVISKSDGDKHKTSEWTDVENKRITIAFDIIPGPVIGAPNQKLLLNHWIPL